MKRFTGRLMGFCRNMTGWLIEKKYGFCLLCSLFFLCFLVWIIYDTLVGTFSISDNAKVIVSNVARLEEMGNQIPPDVEAEEKAKKEDGEDKSESGEVNSNQTDAQGTGTQNESLPSVPDENEEQKKIMTMENPDIGVFNRWFEGCALLGDSLAEGAGEYGFLNQSLLFSKVGCSVAGAGELVDSMEKMHPRKIFIALGMNDMDNYGSRVELFIEHYRNLIKNVRSCLPDAEIYASAVLPMQQKAIQKEPKRKNVALYNEKLEELCGEMTVTFLNPGFILEQDPSLYEQDGIHARKAFYYKWLTYMADMAGVSE